jgi:hypothetical protein
MKVLSLRTMGNVSDTLELHQALPESSVSVSRSEYTERVMDIGDRSMRHPLRSVSPEIREGVKRRVGFAPSLRLTRPGKMCFPTRAMMRGRWSVIDPKRLRESYGA